jgi:hypothetical protein
MAKHSVDVQLSPPKSPSFGLLEPGDLFFLTTPGPQVRHAYMKVPRQQGTPENDGCAVNLTRGLVRELSNFEVIEPLPSGAVVTITVR